MDPVSQLRYILWGPFTVCLMLFTGLYLTIQSRFVQLWAIKYLLHPPSRAASAGGVSPLQALCTSLGGTLGVGNLAGVAIAIALGGPGAIFYMLLAAFFGIATKYSELLLSVRFRIRPQGRPLSGPMVYLSRGAGLRRTAAVFAFCCILSALGTGTAAQSSAITEAVGTVLPLSRFWVSAAVALMLLPILIGGGRRIARVSAVIVPVMTLVYLASGVLVLILHADRIPSALCRIAGGIADPGAAGGGLIGFLGSRAAANGFSKGIFSNEAGLGSAPIAHGCSDADDPCAEGLLGAAEVTIDTFIVCLLTALVILVTGADQLSQSGLHTTISAFSALFGRYSGIFIAAAVFFLACSTILGWCFYGQACLRWLRAPAAMQRLYPWLTACSVLLAPLFPLDRLLQLSDIAAALMAFPNLIGLWVLAPVVRQQTDAFLHAQKSGRICRSDRSELHLNQDII